MTRKRWEAVVSLLVGLAGAAIVLWGDQAGPWLWVWHYLRWVSWPLRCGLALAILGVSLPAAQGLLARAWDRRPGRPARKPRLPSASASNSTPPKPKTQAS